MAEYTVYPRQMEDGTTVYYANWTDKTGRRMRRSTQKSDEQEARVVGLAFSRGVVAHQSRAAKTLERYAAPFFKAGCPHSERIRAEGKVVGARYCRAQRSLLEKFILTDKIAKMALTSIRRRDVLAFRDRMAAAMPGRANSQNKVMGVVKIVFKEALFREDIASDPTTGVGAMAEHRKVRGDFTLEELARLFPRDGLGPWKDQRERTMFSLAAFCGMRRGEILVLKWKHVDIESGIIAIETAWKGRDEIGVPKWGRKRRAALPDIAAQDLITLKAESLHTKEDDFVLAYDLDGARPGETYWTKRFQAAMVRAGIDAKARKISAHSLRHSLNSRLLEVGVAAESLRASLGWSTHRLRRFIPTSEIWR